MRPVIILSGASSKLGNNLCKHLVENGFKVYAGYNSHKEIPKDKHIVPVKLDLTDDKSVKNVIKKISSKQKIFSLVNLVAVSPSGMTLDYPVEDFQRILETNLVGAYRLIYHTLPVIQEGGIVINIGSLSGLISFPRFSLYSASKFALRALSLGLYYEYYPKRKYIVHIAPGALTDGIDKTVSGSVRERLPLLKYLLPLTTYDDVSRKIIKTINNPLPPSEVFVGSDTIILTTIKRIFPNYIWDKVQNYVWRKQQ
jgi:NAD(P)-dependent dehydrogenase (short-subunit alcohol dehydrogenase family)